MAETTNGIDLRPKPNATFAPDVEHAAVVSTPEPIFPELGDSGTARRGGTITGYERNPRLKGVRRWADLSDEMLAVDAKLAQAEDTLRRTLLSAEWTFLPGAAARVGDSPTIEQRASADRALRLAERYNRQWGFDGGAGWFDTPWEMQLSKMLRFVAQGFRYSEEIYGVRDGVVYLKRYADREPSAHLRWIWTEDGEFLAGVEQTPPTPFVGGAFGSDAYVIPASKLLLLTFGQTGQNVEGRGTLRPCWQWYSYKQHAMDLLAIAAEKWAVPTPVVNVDRELADQAGYTAAQIDSAVSTAQTSAARYMSGEQSWLSTIPGVTFDTFGNGNFDPAGLLASISMADQQMLSAWGLAFLEMGLGDVGSRAVGQLLQEQATLAAVNILDTVAGAVNGIARSGGGTVGRLAAWNDAGVQPSELPELTHRGIKINRLANLLPHIPNLINTGAMSPTDDLEAAILVLGGMEMPSDVTRDTLARLSGRNLSPERTSNIVPDGSPERPIAPPATDGEPTDA